MFGWPKDSQCIKELAKCNDILVYECRAPSHLVATILVLVAMVLVLAVLLVLAGRQLLGRIRALDRLEAGQKSILDRLKAGQKSILYNLECSICRNPYDFEHNLLVAGKECGHVFCSNCVQKKKFPVCLVCNKPTPWQQLYFP